MKTSKTIIIITVFVAIELIIGSLIGKYYLDNYPSSGNKSLMYSIINFYLTINVIFFVVTIALGTISIWALKKWERLLSSILISAIIGFIFLIIYTMAFSFLTYTLNIRRIPIFFPLLGFIVGFNWGIWRKGKLQK